jgi:putative (di)nucleoside polyphosphate hydrolase
VTTGRQGRTRIESETETPEARTRQVGRATAVVLMDSESDYFRASVGALIVGRDGRVLAFRRRAGNVGEWQLPQGGLLRDEAPEKAVLREIQEETSIPAAKLQVLEEMDEWLAYELPTQYRTPKTERGQVQKWFLLRFLGTDADIDPDGSEFTEWQWMTASQLLAAAVAFRLPVYRRVLDRWSARLVTNPH